LREIGERDFGDADGGLWQVVRYNGWTEQLAIADCREMNVEYDAVVYGHTHELYSLRQGSYFTFRRDVN